MYNFAVVFVAILAVTGTSAVTYTRCGLAKALLANGMPRNQLENWVCLVEAESSRNTAARGGPNSDGSYDYGLYQINSRYWCRIGSVGGDCHANCNSFLDNNIADDSKCARLIYSRHNFSAWNGWKSKCAGKQLPNLRSCGV